MTVYAAFDSSLPGLPEMRNILLRFIRTEMDFVLKVLPEVNEREMRGWGLKGRSGIDQRVRVRFTFVFAAGLGECLTARPTGLVIESSESSPSLSNRFHFTFCSRVCVVVQANNCKLGRHKFPGLLYCRRLVLLGPDRPLVGTYIVKSHLYPSDPTWLVILLSLGKEGGNKVSVIPHQLESGSWCFVLYRKITKKIVEVWSRSTLESMLFV
jgi:hypothetical protein